MIVIDATDLVLGRMCAFVAKKALLGEEVHIVNSESAVVTGTPSKVLAEYKRMRNMGAPLIGPYFPRTPERIVKRAVRGMLSYKNSRGRDALARVKCHVGVPESLKNEKSLTFKEMNVHKSAAKFVTIKEISKQLGARVE